MAIKASTLSFEDSGRLGYSQAHYPLVEECGLLLIDAHEENEGSLNDYSQ